MYFCQLKFQTTNHPKLFSSNHQINITSQNSQIVAEEYENWVTCICIRSLSFQLECRMKSNKSKSIYTRHRYRIYCLVSCVIQMSLPHPCICFLFYDIPSIISTPHLRETILASKSTSTLSNPVERNITTSSSLQLPKTKPMDSSYSDPNKESWDPIRSLGSLFLQRKMVDESNRQQFNQSTKVFDSTTSTINRTTVNIGRVEIIDETRPKINIPSASTSTIPSISGFIFNATSIFSEFSFKSMGDIDKVSALPR